jgi:hypothetical protein
LINPISNLGMSSGVSKLFQKKKQAKSGPPSVSAKAVPKAPTEEKTADDEWLDSVPTKQAAVRVVTSGKAVENWAYVLLSYHTMPFS